MFYGKIKGFTVIGIVITIGIVGAISAGTIVAVDNAKEKSRDARRKADIERIGLAVQLYYFDNNEVPGVNKPLHIDADTSAGFSIQQQYCASEWPGGNSSGNKYWEDDPDYDEYSLHNMLVGNRYLDILPIDPINEPGTAHCYIYEPHYAPNEDTSGACLMTYLESENKYYGVTIGEAVTVTQDLDTFLSRQHYSLEPSGFDCWLQEHRHLHGDPAII